MTLNVLVVIGQYPPEHSGGGLRIKHTYEVMKEKYGLSYQVLAEPMRTKGKMDLPNVTRIPPSPASALLIYLLLRLVKSRKSIDIVHCIGPTRMTVLAACLCRLLSIPYVTELSIDYDAGRKRHIFSKFLLRYYFQPDGGIALSPRIADTFYKSGLTKNRLFIRPNPVLLDMRENVSDSGDKLLLDAVKKSGFEYRHLLLGRICERKNQMGAVRILNSMPPNHGLILAGPVIGEEDYFERLYDFIHKKNLSSRVILWPHSVANPKFLYDAVTDLWCLSFLEGLPNVVLEALWQGRPCVVTDNLGLSGWIVHEGNGIEIPLNSSPEEAAERIIKSLAEVSDRQNISNEAKEKFNPDRIIEQTYNFLAEISQSSR